MVKLTMEREIKLYVWVHPDEERCGALRRPPRSGLCGSRGRTFETMPRRFDLGVRRPVASRPPLGGVHRIFGYVIPNDGTGCAVNDSGVLGGLRARSQPKANGSNASPA